MRQATPAPLEPNAQSPLASLGDAELEAWGQQGLGSAMLGDLELKGGDDLRAAAPARSAHADADAAALDLPIDADEPVLEGLPVAPRSGPTLDIDIGELVTGDSGTYDVILNSSVDTPIAVTPDSARTIGDEMSSGAVAATSGATGEVRAEAARAPVATTPGATDAVLGVSSSAPVPATLASADLVAGSADGGSIAPDDLGAVAATDADSDTTERRPHTLDWLVPVDEVRPEAERSSGAGAGAGAAAVELRRTPEAAAESAAAAVGPSAELDLEPVAAALEEIARRIRRGELSPPSAADPVSEEAALALALAAVLGVRVR
ncbi:MAG TPA: hypothetical protein VMM18_04745 [Gemmatimonadaceae bacterium]|nr:hypothetical protein [Gemmatimonadaceae bacterium]